MNIINPGSFGMRRCGADWKYCDGKCILCDKQRYTTSNYTKYIPHTNDYYQTSDHTILNDRRNRHDI